MTDPSAFDDKELDANLLRILGPWQNLAGKAPNKDLPVIGPTSDGSYDNFGREAAASYTHSRDFGALKTAAIENRQSSVAPFVKATAGRHRSRRPTAIAAMFVAAPSLGLLFVTVQVLGIGSPTKLNGEHQPKEGRASSSRPALSGAEMKSQLLQSIAEGAVPAELKLVASAETPPRRKATGFRPVEPLKSRMGRPLLIRHTGVKKNIGTRIEDLPIAQVPQHLEAAVPLPATLFNDAPRIATEEIHSAVLAQKVAHARDRRESVNSLRMLRRQ